MNPNTNTVPNSSTTTASGPGSGIGNRFRGAAEVVHGAGEGLRGTLLGAVDTVVKDCPTQNDGIGRQGRLEVERGLAKMKGQTAANTTAYGNTISTAGSTASGTPHATSGATHAPGFGAGTTSGDALHPNHHREDAVAGIPQDELRDVQSHAAQSYSQSQEPHGWHTDVNGFHPTATTQGTGFSNGNIPSANYVQETGAGNAYGPGRDEKIGGYSHRGNETAAKDVQFDTVHGSLAHDQGPGGREMRGLDGRSGLN